VRLVFKRIEQMHIPGFGNADPAVSSNAWQPPAQAWQPLPQGAWQAPQGQAWQPADVAMPATSPMSNGSWQQMPSANWQQQLQQIPVQQSWDTQAYASSEKPAVPAAFANMRAIQVHDGSKSKFAAAFATKSAASKALQAREPIELLAGKNMGLFEMMACQKLQKPVSQNQALAKTQTQLMESLHREALGLPPSVPPNNPAQMMEEFQRQAFAAQQSQNPDQFMKQMQEQMQKMQQQLMQQQFQQQLNSSMMQMQAGQPGESLAGDSGGAEGSRENTDDHANAVFDGVFAAQQAQHMQQMQFVHSVRNQTTGLNTLIGSPTGPLLECRFTDDFRPLQFCKRFFSAEGCRRAEKCTYAHCYEELHPNAPEFAKNKTEIAGGFKEEEKEDDPAKMMPDMRMKKKREICNKWKKDGGCVLGKACPFAHGEKEIGTVALVVCEKVKMKICAFYERGKCVYGKSCINAHGKEEIGLKRPDFMHNAPSGKRRKDGESIDEWRNTVFKQSIFAP